MYRSYGRWIPMNPQPSRTFHQPTFDLLGYTPAVDPAAVELLNRLENRHAIRLPLAVKEWYSCEVAVDILENYTFNPPTAVHLLGNSSYLTDYVETEDGIERLWIMASSVSPYGWAVRLDGSDDPPVDLLVYHDRENEEWVPYADSFSTFVYAMLWDGGAGTGSEDIWQLRAKNTPLTEIMLRSLRSRFTEGPNTYNTLAVPETRDY